MKALFVLTCLLLVPPLMAQPATELKDVKKVYVDSFGNDEGADIIRSKIVTRLVKDRRLQVVLDRDDADAVLIGGGGAIRGASTAGVQLVGKDRIILWADDFSSNGVGWFVSGSPSTHLADDIVSSLIKAIEKAKKKK